MSALALLGHVQPVESDSSTTTLNIPWSERDFQMEKFHLVPNLDHYYRDWRGGLDFYLDVIMPHQFTDLITMEADKVGCRMCQVTTGAARFILGNPVSAGLLTEII